MLILTIGEEKSWNRKNDIGVHINLWFRFDLEQWDIYLRSGIWIVQWFGDRAIRQFSTVKVAAINNLLLCAILERYKKATLEELSRFENTFYTMNEPDPCLPLILPPRYRLRDLILGDYAFNDDGERYSRSVVILLKSCLEFSLSNIGRNE